jgi:hypothetical protein
MMIKQLKNWWNDKVISGLLNVIKYGSFESQKVLVILVAFYSLLLILMYVVLLPKIQLRESAQTVHGIFICSFVLWYVAYNRYEFFINYMDRTNQIHFPWIKQGSNQVPRRNTFRRLKTLQTQGGWWWWKF